MREGESSLSHHLRRRHRQSPPPLREQSDPRRDPIQFAAAIDREDVDGFSLLDSAEKFITDQKVVVIKSDQTHKLWSRTFKDCLILMLISKIRAKIPIMSSLSWVLISQLGLDFSVDFSG
ncbi:hypothetical protein Acr_26g0014060 [Actinidia rufa]|uniref:Uncharacterized protein n=1 Tax=Actinidia rufa TaxID=165716 RepID=A0A7J0H4W5_9ERIC|nr:hypothetical protein Acr_26g0014060 [Actinidia rufa]